MNTQTDPVEKYYFYTSLWNTEDKIKTMTGIPSLAILNKMIEDCKIIKGNNSCIMPMRERILLTMRKLKANVNFCDLAIDFETTRSTVREYFGETIQLLSKVRLVYFLYLIITFYHIITQLLLLFNIYNPKINIFNKKTQQFDKKFMSF